MRKTLRRRKVALIIETSSSYGRGLLSGVEKYMRLEKNWSVFLEQRNLTQRPPAWLSNWDGDGVISRATTPALRRAVARNQIGRAHV